MLRRIGQIFILSDNADWEITCNPTLSDTSIQNRRFMARVTADNQQRICIVNVGNTCIEQIICTHTIRRQLRTILTAIEIRTTKLRHQIF